MSKTILVPLSCYGQSLSMLGSSGSFVILLFTSEIGFSVCVYIVCYTWRSFVLLSCYGETDSIANL
jgi:hypothetical protein